MMRTAIWFTSGSVEPGDKRAFRERGDYIAHAYIKSEFVEEKLRVEKDIKPDREEEDINIFKMKVREISAKMIDYELNYFLKGEHE